MQQFRCAALPPGKSSWQAVRAGPIRVRKLALKVRVSINNELEERYFSGAIARKVSSQTADWTKNGVIVGYRSIPQALDSKINFLGCIRISAGLQNRGRRFDSDLRLQS
jgi:hypothetical protein